MKLGAHMSIEGGVSKAIRRGAGAGCQTVQVFTKNNTRWHGVYPSTLEIAAFQSLQDETGINPVFAHASYLINLASGDPVVRERSITALTDELNRCQQLHLPMLVLHPGSHGGRGEQTGIRSVIEGLTQALSAAPESRVRILLETTAGQGHDLGHRFEHLHAILAGTGMLGRTGVCLDTCHVFAAGYDLRDEESYRRTIEEFDRIIGLARLFALHLNDSKKPLGARVDRHQHIGHGHLGVSAFRQILNDPRLDHLPAVLETPKNKQCDEDKVNLAVLRGLQKGQPAGLLAASG